MSSSPNKGERIKCWSRYKRLCIAGAGAFGQVYVGRRVESSDAKPPPCVAIKRIFLHGSDEQVQSAAVEVKVLESLDPHSNVVKYVDHFIDDENHVNIVMELVPHGDLESFLQRRRALNKPIKLKEALFFGFQLLAAVRHLHECCVMHRDLKPSNIYLSFDGCASEPANIDGLPDGTLWKSIVRDLISDDEICNATARVTLKVADFGISKVLEETHGTASTVIGTPFYLAPELCNGETYTNAADVWAVGAILFEIATTGEKCFPGDNMLAVVRAICTSGDKVPRSRMIGSSLGMSTALRPLIDALLQHDASARMSCAQTIKHFFTPDVREDPDWQDEFEDPSDDD